MKNIFPIIALAVLASCTNNAGQKTDAESPVQDSSANVGWFGEQFDLAGSVPAESVPAMMNDTSSLELVVDGTINECCQKKGCWMKIDLGSGESMRVSFKDYGFFVPKDAAGKSMTMKGIAMYDTIAVDMLKHLAEDAGKTEQDIAAITEPELALTFEASGVLIK